MKKIFNEFYWKVTMGFNKRIGKMILNRKGFGINEVIGLAAGIIVAAVVIIPGLKSFATLIMDKLSEWWTDMAAGIFST